MKLRYILNNIAILGTKEKRVSQRLDHNVRENMSLGGELSESWLRKTHFYGQIRRSSLPLKFSQKFSSKGELQKLFLILQAVAVRNATRRRNKFFTLARSLHTQFSLTRWDVPKIQPIFYISTQHFFYEHAISQFDVHYDDIKIFDKSTYLPPLYILTICQYQQQKQKKITVE
jgi:hypothetical protein